MTTTHRKTYFYPFRVTCDVAPWRRFVDGLPAYAKPARGKPIRLVCFDLDGVLVEQESSWVSVHRHFGVNNDESLHAFLEGRIGEEEFIHRDVALWLARRPGLTLKEVESVLDQLTLVPGAVETLHRLREHGVEVAIVSGGIESAVRSVANQLGIRHFSGNALSVDHAGRLTGAGRVNTPLRDKAVPVRRFAHDLGVPLENVASVGNSSPDIPMFRTCGLGVAFRPVDDYVKEAADVIVEGNDLQGILPAILGSAIPSTR